jgi:hypothetical protein
MKNIKADMPRQKNLVPKWDLAIVLQGLRLEPFEPLESCSVRHLTYKTLFLIALATAARVSELGALSAVEGHIRFTEGKSSVTLLPFEGFLAKNQSTKDPPLRMVIKALTQFTPIDDPEALLCPVRALRIYLKRTNCFRGDRQRVFLSYVEKFKRDVTSQTLSRYIRETIKMCYQGQAPKLANHFHASAHEVRAFATSTLLWKNCSIVNVLRAANWKNHNTFTSFYFRNMTHVIKAEKKGGGVIVAGHRLTLNI